MSFKVFLIAKVYVSISESLVLLPLEATISKHSLETTVSLGYLPFLKKRKLQLLLSILRTPICFHPL